MDDVLAVRAGSRRHPGAEWFTFSPAGLITEIRSYYQQRPESTELDGFPYAGRGYSTLAGA